MSDNDKILNAEQSIKRIASELERMRKATELLEDAQKKTDEVLGSAKQIIDATEQFSRACGEIIKELSSTDLRQRLDEIQTETKLIATIESHIKNMEDEFRTAGKKSKARQMITMVFVILTFVVSLTASIALLIPVMGG